MTACLPERFEVDGDGRKAAWREAFLQRVQGLVAQVCVFFSSPRAKEWGRGGGEETWKDELTPVFAFSCVLYSNYCWLLTPPPYYCSTVSAFLFCCLVSVGISWFLDGRPLHRFVPAAFPIERKHHLRKSDR